MYDFRNNLESKLNDERFISLCDEIQAQDDTFPERFNDMLDYPEDYIKRTFGEFVVLVMCNFYDDIIIEIGKIKYWEDEEQTIPTGATPLMTLEKRDGKWSIVPENSQHST